MIESSIFSIYLFTEYKLKTGKSVFSINSTLSDLELVETFPPKRLIVFSVLTVFPFTSKLAVIEASPVKSL